MSIHSSPIKCGKKKTLNSSPGTISHLPLTLIFDVFSEKNKKKLKLVQGQSHILDNCFFFYFIRKLIRAFFILAERKLLRDYLSVKLNSILLMHIKKMDQELGHLNKFLKGFSLVQEKKFSVSFENTEFINCCMDQMAQVNL